MTAHLGLISEAPQLWAPITLRESCQGQELGVAVDPPIIRAPGRCPQPVGKKKEKKEKMATCGLCSVAWKQGSKIQMESF